MLLTFRVSMGLRRRNRTAPDLPSEVPINLIPNILRRDECNYDVSPSGGPRTRRSDFLLEHALFVADLRGRSSTADHCPACIPSSSGPWVIDCRGA